jgi:hypothetical protein
VKTDYYDITEKLGEPLWYDSEGVPRYCEFSPMKCGIYIDSVALVEIECQHCGKGFKVARQMDRTNMLMPRYIDSDWQPTLPNPREGVIGSFHYGDPPAHPSGPYNRCTGDTMNSVPIEVLEFWDRRDFGDWTRRPECEGVLEDFDWK